MTEVDENPGKADPGAAPTSDEAGTHVLYEPDPKGKRFPRPKSVSPLHARRAGCPRDRLRAPSCPARCTAAGSRVRSRRDPVDLLEEQAQTRLPELVPIRYGRMLASPFTFFRGGAYLMAADLADGPRTGLQAQLCGDAHLSNFGIFAAPDRGASSASTTSTRRCRGRSSGTSSGLQRASRWRPRPRPQRGERRSVVIAGRGRVPRAMLASPGMRNIDVWYTRLDLAGIVKRLPGRRPGSR